MKDKLSAWILRLVHAFEPKDSRRDDIRDLAERVKKLEGFVRDCAVNWDCDEDGHKYGTGCRCCEAQQLLDEVVEVELV